MANTLAGVKGFVRSDPVARFWAKVDKRGPDECWPWLASTDGRYGAFHVNGKRQRASRFAWELANGQPFPQDRDACHTCDNTRCVNPAHIWPGTASENALDAVRKGRVTTPTMRGEPAWKASQTHCLKGHPFAGENLITREGYRRCRTCWNAAKRRYEGAKRARLRAERAAVLSSQDGQP